MEPNQIARFLAEDDAIPARGVLQNEPADTRPDDDYDPQQLAMGIKVEMEHTDNEEIAKRIAKDHLDEFSDYYTRLEKMENEAKQEHGITEAINIGERNRFLAKKIQQAIIQLKTDIYNYMRHGKIEDILGDDPLSQALKADVLKKRDMVTGMVPSREIQ